MTLRGVYRNGLCRISTLYNGKNYIIVEKQRQGAVSLDITWEQYTTGGLAYCHSLPITKFKRYNYVN